MPWYFSDGGFGGAGAVVRCTIDVTPGEQFPVVVGAAGAAGAQINVSSWVSDGGNGGTSSFGDIAVGGGTGGTQTGAGRNAAFANTASAVVVGSVPGGNPASGNTVAVAAGSTAGGSGFELVEW